MFYCNKIEKITMILKTNNFGNNLNYKKEEKKYMRSAMKCNDI